MASITYDDLIKEIETYITDKKELKVIDDAYTFALSCHKDKQRKTGEDYITHPLNVAMILTTLNADYITLAAALLHETINHGNATKEMIEEKFGEDIAKIVDSTSKINKLTLNDDKESTIINLRKVIVGLSENVRVLYIKLADRLHNMRTVWALDAAEKKAKIQETENVLIPIAARLGINSIKSELEDLCLKHSKPNVYNEIVNSLKDTQEELNNKLEDMKEDISNILSEHNINFKIKGRVKSVHSIYEKMLSGHKWNEIYDILALRIIVERVDECYLAIGLIHAKYRPLPNRFKDYIAMPKENMYQSLHTSVIGVDSYVFEIQVRTYEMDEVAEKGIASHWSYKEHSDGSITNIMEEKLEMFRNLIEQEKNDVSDDFEKAVNTEFLGKMIYCFTPKGDVVELPKGATPIDFAYRIHSRVGDTTIGAIVNNKIVTLDSELSDGDIINIKTSSNATPSKEWLSFVKTSQAKNKIKSYFSKQDKEYYISLGKDLLEKEIRKRKLSLSDVLSSEHIKKLTEDLKLENIEDIYLSIGSLRYTPTFIINSIYEDKKDVSDILIKKIENSYNKNNLEHVSDIIVSGASNIKVSLAKCCNPIKGDDIIGYITRGQGISVHLKDCPNVKNETDRLINVSWNNDNFNEYFANIRVVVDSSNSKLLDIIAICSTRNIIVDSIKTKNEDINTIYILTLKIKDIKELDSVIIALENLSYVKKAERVIN